MRRFVVVGLVIGLLYSCKEFEKDPSYQSNTGGEVSVGGEGSVDSSGGSSSSGDGDGDSSGGKGSGSTGPTSGDGDGDSDSGGDGSGGDDGTSDTEDLFDCEAGFTGERCDECDAEHFGEKCEPCDCGGGSCSDGVSGDGSCTCSTGFEGETCDECEANHFGSDCEPCSCENGTCDDGIDGSGSCSCNTGWEGESCSECKSGFFGASCALCECDQGSCSDGLTGDGSCSCNNGWAPPSCDSCSADFFGSTCSSCDCSEGNCDDGLSGSGTCFDCPSGFVGTACDQCQSNRFGSSCSLCTCQHGACDEGRSGSGACECDQGWAGTSCTSCAVGYFGAQCLACPSTPTLGCTCSGNGTLACNGTAQKVRLSCNGGEWALGGSCSGSENCDQTAGTCAPIVAGCSGKTGGFKFCVAPDQLNTCGADLVSTSVEQCDGLCSNSSGSCLAPKCGDGKIQASLSEECDDSNQAAGDGCEPDCKESTVVKVAVGVFHACILTGRGDVRCWGDNTYNQLGLGHTNLRAAVHPYQNALVDLGGTATDVVAGIYHTCALLSDKTIRCWGRNQDGQLGLGNTTVMATQVPATIGAISVGGQVNQIGANSNQTCARLSTGSVRCWGANSFGQLGLGHTTTVSRTTLPSALTVVSIGGTAKDMAVGSGSTCVLLDAGGLRCWGYNTQGQLGRQHNSHIGNDMNELPDAVDPLVPAGFDNRGLVPVPIGRTVSRIVGGDLHFCAVFDNQNMQCWGSNSNGELGLGTTNHVADVAGEPPSTLGLISLGTGKTVTQIAIGGDSTCVIHNTGELKCWGFNDTAELGLADTDPRGTIVQTRPTGLSAIALGANLTASLVSGGGGSTCLLHNNGRVRCWGFNSKGQLGLGYSSTSPDYIGGDPSQTPDQLAFLLLFNGNE